MSAGPPYSASRKWAIAATAALGALMEIVDTSIVNVALSDMQSSLGATLSEVGWVVTSYAIANVVVLPLTAWLGAIFGKKRYYVFSLVGFTVASFLCGISTSLWTLVLARTLQGLTGGGLLSKAQSILFETFPPEEQPMAQALFGVVAIAGPVIGPTLGGYIVTNLDWRWIFFINLPIGIASISLAGAYLPSDSEAKTEVKSDIPGLVLLFVGLGALQWVLEEGQSEDWFESKAVLLATVAAVVGLALFVWRELSIDHPVVDLRVLRHRSLAAGSAFSLVLGATLYGALFAIPVFAQTIMHLTAQQTGMVMAPGALFAAFTMPLAGKLVRTVDPRFLICGGALTLLTAVLQLAHLSVNSGEDSIYWPMIVRSIGTVFMFLPLSIASLGGLPKEDIGKATAFYNLTRQLGGSIGVAFLTTFLSRRIVQNKAAIAAHLTATDPGTQERVARTVSALGARGMDALHAKQLAVGQLTQIAAREAMIRAFNDTFHATAILIVVTLPVVFLLRRPKAAVAVDAH